MGVNVSGTSGTDSEDAGATRQKEKKPTPKAVKRLRAAPGWEDFTEDKQLRRNLLPDYQDETSPTPKVVKRLCAAQGWEDFTEGKQLRRNLLPDYQDETSF